MLKIGLKFFWDLTPSVKRALVWQFLLPGKALGPGRPKITSPWPLPWGGISFGTAPTLGLYPTPKEYPLNSWGTKQIQSVSETPDRDDTAGNMKTELHNVLLCQNFMPGLC